MGLFPVISLLTGNFASTTPIGLIPSGPLVKFVPPRRGRRTGQPLQEPRKSCRAAYPWPLLRIAVLRAIECWSVVGRHEGPVAKIRTHCLSWSSFRRENSSADGPSAQAFVLCTRGRYRPLLIGLGARCRSRRLRGCAVSLFRPIVSGVGVRNTEKFPCSVMYGICSLSH